MAFADNLQPPRANLAYGRATVARCLARARAGKSSTFGADLLLNALQTRRCHPTAGSLVGLLSHMENRLNGCCDGQPREPLVRLLALFLQAPLPSVLAVGEPRLRPQFAPDG